MTSPHVGPFAAGLGGERAGAARPGGGMTVGSVGGHALVHGVHGAPGRTGWKALAARRHLRSATEAVEWATIPPGGLSGEHRHTRTEEIYLILAGSGEFLLNGEAVPVQAGTLALTALGNVHGLRNTGRERLDWWVVETLAARTSSAIAARRQIGEPDMTTATVHDLTQSPVISTCGTFTGPLSRVERIELRIGDDRALGEPAAEVACFVQHGDAIVESAGETARLTAGCCVVLPAGANATLVASALTTAYAVTLRIPGNGS